MTQRETKINDYNGVIVSTDGFKSWLRKENPELFEGYLVRGEKDKELKRTLRPRVLELYEDATNRGLYQVTLIPNAVERLRMDGEQGVVRTIFTSISRDLITAQLRELRLDGDVDVVLVLDDICMAFDLPEAMKEDPAVFAGLADYVAQHIGRARTYTDDAQARIEAAAKANQRVREGKPGFERLFMFNPKAAAETIPREGYTEVKSLLLVE